MSGGDACGDNIAIMNAAGYDVTTAGNHEFDYGLDQFAKFREMANFPIMSANAYKDNSLLCAGDGNNGANVGLTLKYPELEYAASRYTRAG